MEINQLALSGTVTEIKPVKVSPAGVEQLRFKLRHCSKQQELQKALLVEFEVWVVVVGEKARYYAQKIKNSQQLEVEGFIDIAGYFSEQKKRMVLRAHSINIA